MNVDTASRRIIASVLLVTLAISSLLARKIERLRGPATIDDVVYMRSPRLIKFLCLGFTGLAASIYWTRVVQYFGHKHYEASLEYDSLAPLLDLTTQLDPHLEIAYEFGSIFLAQKPPEGAGQPAEAVKLVERGIKENPDAWRLYYQIGYIQYLELHDPLAAARSFELGAAVPGAYPWMKVMAAMLLHKAGDLNTSRYLWQGIYASSADPSIKRNALVRLAALQVDQDVLALQQAVNAYRSKYHAVPHNWLDLIRSGLIHRTPVDPSGRAYILTGDGRVQVNDYKRFPFITQGLPPGVHSGQFITPGAVEAKPN